MTHNDPSFAERCRRLVAQVEQQQLVTKAQIEAAEAQIEATRRLLTGPSVWPVVYEVEE